jgi:hypothetical protein
LVDLTDVISFLYTIAVAVVVIIFLKWARFHKTEIKRQREEEEEGRDL